MRRILFLFTLISALPVASANTSANTGGQERKSAFGEYEGYSEQRFDHWETFSTYVEMRDGVLLAVDFSLPSKGGDVTEEALPLVWTHSRYHRRMGGYPMPDGNASLQRLLRHGYVVASVAVRGSGASFGAYEGLFSEAETQDAVEIIEWFTDQPFCDGNIGMYGGSYLGITQYMAASKAPSALKAIFPDVAALDMYDTVYPGGVFREDMLNHWASLTSELDHNVPAVAVDDDFGGLLRKRAVAEHAGNWDVAKEYGAGKYRSHEVETLRWVEHGPVGCLGEIKQAKVPAYHCNGWFDVFAMDAVLWFANYDGPQRLVMGNWSHAQLTRERSRVTSVEQHRWFDYWLKGTANGILDEAPIRYALMNEGDEMSWESAEQWPPAGLETRMLHFTSGPSGSVKSHNDGGLSLDLDAESTFDEYAIDLTTTTGKSTRWDNAVGAVQAMSYPDLAANDTKCLTYTTDVLEENLVVVGHPVVSLWLTAEKGDANLHVLLEEIDEKGSVSYVTEGVLKASQRKLTLSPFDNLGLPYQRCYAEDEQAVPNDRPVQVRMDLHPTANIFNAGHRLRVSIMGADADNTQASKLTNNSLRVFRGGEWISGIELPVVP